MIPPAPDAVTQLAKELEQKWRGADDLSVEDDWHRLARHVLRREVEARREAFVMARTDHELYETVRTCRARDCETLMAEANAKYPMPDAEPPRTGTTPSLTNTEWLDAKADGAADITDARRLRECAAHIRVLQERLRGASASEQSRAPKTIEPLPTDRFAWDKVVERVNELVAAVNELRRHARTTEGR